MSANVDPSRDDPAAARAADAVFWRLHQGLPKQGPGSDASSRRALALAHDLPPAPRVLDLGCGPGRQSLVLARETGGTVVAVDLVPPFLAQLAQRSRAAGFERRIAPLRASMDALPFSGARFDLLWSEGAIYNVGFDRGLADWRRLLAPGGWLVVSEAVWLVDEPPARIRAFWETAYPAMRDVAANERAIRAAGFRLAGSFLLSESEWWDAYYTPIEARVAALRAERSDAAWQAALDAATHELSIVREGLDCFGYAFFAMRMHDA